ncbi:MAG: sigma-54 dependent transcriptional regulator [Candidatus Binatia bacterium]|nr:sigma-54 dependent transcriptional regulator [Candidatus Binatia bacterium]
MERVEDRGAPDRPTALVVDDDLVYTAVLVAALRDRVPGLRIETAESLEAATLRVESSPVDVLVLDVSLPDGDGLGVVRGLRRRGEEVPFVLLTADGSARTAVRALHAGALDYFVKGGGAVDGVAGLLGDLVAARRVGPESTLVGASPQMRAVRAEVRRCGRSLAPVRIEGETGVGKELVARAIHGESTRAKGAFVAVNCGALPEALAEAELFGHVRGAYTGAGSDRAGLVEHASGGTLMLDEVEDLPASIQGKLLRLIQEHEYRPVGTARLRTAEVRILAASNRNLESMVQQGTFRRDLFYRLDVLRVRVPPLRERPSDLSLLVAHLLKRGGRGEGFPGASGRALPLAADLARMELYDWPGNVRELENFVERARAVADVAGWRAGWASALGQLPSSASRGSDRRATVVAESSPDEVEREELERLLGRHRWRREAAARELGISRVTLWRRMRRHGLMGEF